MTNKYTVELPDSLLEFLENNLVGEYSVDDVLLPLIEVGLFYAARTMNNVYDPTTDIARGLTPSQQMSVQVVALGEDGGITPSELPPEIIEALAQAMKMQSFGRLTGDPTITPKPTIKEEDGVIQFPSGMKPS